jgi:hypothetical protein
MWYTVADLCCNKQILEIQNFIFMQWCTWNQVHKRMEARLHVAREVKGNWLSQNLNTKRVECDALFQRLKENSGEDFGRCVRGGGRESEGKIYLV